MNAENREKQILTMNLSGRWEGYSMSERSNATIIWNADKSWEEKIAALKEISAFTSDDKLKNQIIQRVNFEEKMLGRFKENSDNRCIFVVNEHRNNVGYFANFDMAKEYAVKLMEKNDTLCQILKQRIVFTSEDLMVHRTCCYSSEYNKPMKEYTEPYDGFEIASVKLTKNGGIMDIWSDEMSLEERAAVNEYDLERFEYQFVDVPFEGERGTIVKVTGSPDKYEDYGVLLTDTAEWNMVRDMPHRKDFTDIAVTVVYLTELGLWRHEHINPLYLDFDVRPEAHDEKGKAYIDAMTALSEYFRFGNDQNVGQYFTRAIETAKKYRDICREIYDKARKRPHENAKSINDIIY